MGPVTVLLPKSQVAIWEFLSSVFLEPQTHGRHAHLAHFVDADSWSTPAFGEHAWFGRLSGFVSNRSPHP